MVKIRSTWTATTNVESACSTIDVVAISAMPPGANAKIDVISPIPVILETSSAQTNIAAIKPIVLISATTIIFLRR